MIFSIYSSYSYMQGTLQNDLECVLPVLVGFDICDNDCGKYVMESKDTDQGCDGFRLEDMDSEVHL